MQRRRRPPAACARRLVVSPARVTTMPNHTLRVFRCAMFAALTGASVTAQTIWTVGGSGANFTNLRPAVAAAQDGDVILVQPGSYNVEPGIVTNKALRILGGPGRQLLPSSLYPILSVSGLPSGAQFVFDGFALSRSWYGSGQSVGAILLSANPGIVHLANLSIDDFSFDRWSDFQNCRLVTMTRCQSTVEIQCSHSDLTIVECNLRGRRARWLPTGYGFASSSALFTLGSEVHIARSVLTGGDGDVTMPPNAALAGLFGHIVIAGDGTSVIAAGQPGTTPASAASAVSIASIVLEIDPAVPLVPNAGAPPIELIPPSSSSTVITASQVAVTTSGGNLGGIALLSLYSPAGNPFALCAAPVAAAPIPTPFGNVWVDPNLAVYLAPGVQDASGVTTTSVAVPNNTALLGAVFGIQALSADANTAATTLSQLAVITLR